MRSIIGLLTTITRLPQISCSNLEKSKNTSNNRNVATARTLRRLNSDSFTYFLKLINRNC